MIDNFILAETPSLALPVRGNEGVQGRREGCILLTEGRRIMLCVAQEFHNATGYSLLGLGTAPPLQSPGHRAPEVICSQIQ